MSKISTAIKLIRNNPIDIIGVLFDKFRYTKLLRLLSDEHFVRLCYFFHFGHSLNLDNPRTFNEKLQWLKLNNKKKLYTSLVDKCAVKDYVASIIGDEYIIKTLGEWNSFEEIDFESLPNSFVLKCNHDSGSVVVCKDKSKLDYKKSKQILNRGLKRNLFYWGREYPYKDVKPKIFAETYLEDKSDGDLKDYKFFCFMGEVKCFKIDFDRFVDHHANYYDCNGKLLPISEKVCPSDEDRKLVIPSNLAKMISLAETLSKEIPFLRVDFYNLDSRIFFGELTFFPASGLCPFEHKEADDMMGEWLKL